ncbi:hypothetical protein FGB62_25g549 [Gracilaria domingensis]|nr:hypothetical protein FGB62_25g549 [Gracilaria domingensis]
MTGASRSVIAKNTSKTQATWVHQVSSIEKTNPPEVRGEMARAAATRVGNGEAQCLSETHQGGKKEDKDGEDYDGFETTGTCARYVAGFGKVAEGGDREERDQSVEQRKGVVGVNLNHGGWRWGDVRGVGGGGAGGGAGLRVPGGAAVAPGTTAVEQNVPREY